MLNRIVPALALLILASVASLRADSVEALLRQRGEAFVAAMNRQGDALTAFARNHLESRVAREGLAGRLAERVRDTFAELGPIERHSLQVLRDGRLLFVYGKHAKSGTWQNYQFRVIADDGHRLQLVFRAVAIEPMERPAAPLGSPKSGPWLQKFQAALDAQQPFSGIALVRSRGQELYSLVKGVADATSNAPVTRGTRFGMASGSKMFTAVAVLQLAQAGKLSLTGGS